MRWLSFAIILFLFLPHSYAAAQNSNSFVQTELNAIFVVDADRNTTTAMVGFSYVEPVASEIQWVIPLPPGAVMTGLANPLFLVYAGHLTEPLIEPPLAFPLACSLSIQNTFGDGYLPTPQYFPPDDAGVESLNLADDVINFLSASDQQLTANQQAALNDYEAQGYTFAGIHLTPESTQPSLDAMWANANIHLSNMVTIEYPGTEPVFPLAFYANDVASHLANYDYDRTMTVTAYVFADIPYAPANLPTFVPDLSRIDPLPSEIEYTMQLTYGNSVFFNMLDPDYYQLMRNAIESNGGEAFVGEYIGEAQAWSREGRTALESTAIDRYNEIIDGHPVVSRWRTFIAEGQSASDLILAPAPDLPSFKMALQDYVDPAWFFGCTTRKLYDADVEERLPAGRTNIEPLHLALAHPDDWVLTELEDDTETVYVLSPVTVTYEMLTTMREERTGPPMLVVQGIEQDVSQVEVFEQVQAGRLPVVDEPSACAAKAYFLPSPHAVTQGDISPSAPLNSNLVTLLSTLEDCAANESMYQDMLDYAESFQYFLSPELRHTLFVGELNRIFAVGYPDGWVESVIGDETRLIAPEGAAYEDAPAVLIPNWRAADDETDWLERYGLTALPEGILTPFEADGRRGFVVRTYGFFAPVVEFSAPTDHFETYADLLRLIADTAWITPPPPED